MGLPLEKEIENAEVAESSQQFPALDWLYELLSKFEEAEGSMDLQTREKLHELYLETTRVPPSSGGEAAEAEPSQMDESSIESQLASLSERIELLKTRVSELPQEPEVANFLGATSELWLPVLTATVDERRERASS